MPDAMPRLDSRQTENSIHMRFMKKIIRSKRAQNLAISIAIAWLGACYYLSIPDPLWLPGIIPDSAEPYYATLNLAQGKGYFIQPNPAGEFLRPRYPFGFTVFFLLPLKWIGLPNAALFSVTEFCIIATALFAFRIGLKDGGRRVAVPFAVGCLFLPDLQLNARELLSHCPALLLFMAAWWGLNSQDRFRIFLAGVFLGIGVTVRPAGLLLGLTAGLAIVLANGIRWRDSVKQLVWLALGSVPLVIALLAFNKMEFGGWLRTGYSYHCSVPYDFGFLLFNWDPEFLAKNAWGYLFPYGNSQIMIFLSVLILLFAGIGMLSLLRVSLQKSDWPAGLTFPLLSAVAIFLFHISHVFFNPAFIYITYIVILWLGICGILVLFRRVAGIQPLPGIVTWVVVGLIVAVGCGKLSRRIKKGDGWDSRRGNAEIFHTIQPFIPQQCQIVVGQGLNPLIARYELVKTPERTMLTFDRGVEYSNKVINREPPDVDLDANTHFQDHSKALEWGGVKIFPTTFQEDPTQFLDQPLPILFINVELSEIEKLASERTIQQIVENVYLLEVE